jgi:hypothetical protein
MAASPRPLAPVVATEIALVLLVLFGDIGFDRPGRFGLAFDHLLLFAAAFVVVWTIGTWRAVRLRRWPAVALQISLPFCACAGLAYVQAPPEVPRFRAEEHQHLVGRNELDVQAELGDAAGATLFILEQDGAADLRELQLAGMTVRYSAGKVAAVEPNER